MKRRFARKRSAWPRRCGRDFRNCRRKVDQVFAVIFPSISRIIVVFSLMTLYSTQNEYRLKRTTKQENQAWVIPLIITTSFAPPSQAAAMISRQESVARPEVRPLNFLVRRT